jgi:hypothetical protein
MFVSIGFPNFILPKREAKEPQGISGEEKARIARAV